MKQKIDVNKAVVARTAYEQIKEQQTSKAKDSKGAQQKKLKTNGGAIQVQVNKPRQ